MSATQRPKPAAYPAAYPAPYPAPYSATTLGPTQSREELAEHLRLSIEFVPPFLRLRLELRAQGCNATGAIRPRRRARDEPIGRGAIRNTATRSSTLHRASYTDRTI